MRSIRLDPQLEAKVQRAAEAEHTTFSEFVRKAIADRAEHTLGGQPDTLERLRDVIGIVHSNEPDLAEHGGEIFTDMLVDNINHELRQA